MMNIGVPSFFNHAEQSISGFDVAVLIPSHILIGISTAENNFSILIEYASTLKDDDSQFPFSPPNFH